MIFNYVNCFGDSLTTGARDPEGLNYGFWLARALTDHGVYDTHWYSIVRAVNGYKIVDVWRNIYDWCKSTPEAKLTLLLIGSNDCKNQGTAPSVFYDLYKQTIDVCIMENKKLVTATLPPITHDAIPEFFSLRVDELRFEYNKIIEEFAKEYKLPMCDLADFPIEYLVDGIHLTDKGNFYLADRFFKLITSEGLHGKLRRCLP